MVHRHGQGEIADGQVVPFNERSSVGSVFLENVLDLLNAAFRAKGKTNTPQHDTLHGGAKGGHTPI